MLVWGLFRLDLEFLKGWFRVIGWCWVYLGLVCGLFRLGLGFLRVG